MRGFNESSNEDPSKKNKKNLNYPVANNFVLLNKALAMEKKGFIKDAAQIYQKLIKNKFRNEIVFINYGSICQHFSETDNAILLFKEAIKINPKNPIPFFKMGFILNNNGNFYEAKKIII